jgi:simple sugar transport system substrate-binding protein
MKQVQFVAVILLLTALIVGCVAPAAAPAPAAEAPAAEAPAAEGEAAAPSDLTFTTVVKIAGINWFNRMEEGVKKFGADTGINASLVGPAEADAAQQIPIIEDLIAQGVDALCVVPMDPTQLDPVLQKAMDAGITVITHEASNQNNMDWDIEAFDNSGLWRWPDGSSGRVNG